VAISFEAPNGYRCRNGVDRFFGNTGMARRTVFPPAFWLKTPAPLQTAPAFGVCCWLSSTVREVVAVWTIPVMLGRVRPASGLRPNVPGRAIGQRVCRSPFVLSS
jgi:hypothetical protein